MTIVVTGGGSGGHITPILAVAHELKQLKPDARIVYIGQKGDSLSDVPARDPNIDQVFAVSAGKFRRYHGEGLKQLLDLKTMLLNVRDVFRVLAGLGQSYRLLKKLRPDVVFIKGGFVGVPVGLMAAKLHIPFITHDSDAIPGLANRIVARWAAKHAVALPAEVYKGYDQAKTVTVGVPVRAEYQPVTPELKAQYRADLQYALDAPVVFVIGGGLGAQRINDAMLACAPSLFERFPALRLVHAVGRANEQAVQARYATVLPAEKLPQVQVFGYMDDVYRYSGAADVVVTRAGATSLADFAVQGKACIVIPNPFLTAGHQLKNAEYLAKQQATEQITETELVKNPQLLEKALTELLQDPARQAALGKVFTNFGHPQAARELAELILQEVRV